MLDQGVWAEVKVGDDNLRLFLGVQASVYNVKAKNWIAPSEVVEDIEQGKDRAACQGVSSACRQFRTAAVGMEEIPLPIIQETLAMLPPILPTQVYIASWGFPPPRKFSREIFC